MPERLVLDASPALVELAVGVLDHVKRIGDLADMGEGVVVDLAVGARHVQHALHLIPARHDSGCASIHSETFAAVRDSTTSTSFARRPRPPTSTTDVAHSWVRHSPRRTNSVSSNPNADTAPTRSTSASRTASPYATTASHTVCQSHPSSSATFAHRPPRLPDLPGRPPPARSVNAAPRRRDPRIRTVQRPAGHSCSRHRHRVLRHTNRAGRPKHGRSTNSTASRSFTTARHPLSTPPLIQQRLDNHPDRAVCDVVDGEDGHLWQAQKQLTHARRVDLQQGLSRLDGVGTTDSVEPLPRARGPLTPPGSDPAQIRSAPIGLSLACSAHRPARVCLSPRRLLAPGRPRPAPPPPPPASPPPPPPPPP